MLRKSINKYNKKRTFKEELVLMLTSTDVLSKLKKKHFGGK